LSVAVNDRQPAAVDKVEQHAVNLAIKEPSIKGVKTSKSDLLLVPTT